MEASEWEAMEVTGWLQVSIETRSWIWASEWEWVSEWEKNERCDHQKKIQESERHRLVLSLFWLEWEHSIGSETSIFVGPLHDLDDVIHVEQSNPTEEAKAPENSKGQNLLTCWSRLLTSAHSLQVLFVDSHCSQRRLTFLQAYGSHSQVSFLTWIYPSICLNSRVRFYKILSHPLRPRTRAKHSIKHYLAPLGRRKLVFHLSVCL